MAILKAKQRNKLAKKTFGDPATRSYPLNDAAHVGNAAARLEQQKKAGKVSPSKYAKIRANIARAAKAKGVASKYNAKGGS